MTTVRVRIAPDCPEMKDIRAVTVYGFVVTREYSEVEITDDVLAKLKTNPTFETLVRAPKADGPTAKA